MKDPRREGGDGDGGDERPGGGRSVSGTLIVTLMLTLTIALWSLFTWMAASRFEGLGVVTFRSEYPGEVRVLGLPFGDDQAWEPAFLDRYPGPADLTRDEWIAARTDASWLQPGFFSGRSLHRLDEQPGFTYRVELRDGPGASAAPQVVHVPFASAEETRLLVDSAGRLWISAGPLALPKLLSGGKRPAGEWPGQRRGALTPPPAVGDPLLPEMAGLPFREADG